MFATGRKRIYSSETTVLKRIQLALSNGAIRLWRNNVGQAYQGKCLRVSPLRLIIDSPRVVHFGLCEGSADLIGFQSVTITPEMVGQRIAQFVSVEVKAKRGRLAEDQQRWADLVRQHGGIAGTARSIMDAKQLLMVGPDHDVSNSDE